MEQDGMARFMVGGDFLLGIGNNAASFLRTDPYLDKSSLDIFLGHKHPIRFGSQDSGLIQKVFQIRPGKTGGRLGDLF